MSMPHNFTDDPNSFPGPARKSSNTTVIVVAIVIVGGTLMLIFGGIIFGVVMSVRQAQQEVELVMDDMQWDSNFDQPAFQEYSSFVGEGRYSEAIESVDRALASDPDNAFLHNNKAWLLATCPDDAVRDGEIAVEHATKACELTNWNHFAYVDTVAAAYAESGDFESAVRWQEEAIGLTNSTYLQDFQRRLRLFKAGKPYREGVAPYIDPAEEQPVEAAGTDTPASEDDEITITDETSNQEDQESR